MNEIHNKVEEIGLKIIKGSELEKEEINLEDCLAFVKRSLIVDFGEYGMHLPDADLVIYDPQKCKAVAIISSKTTLRENCTGRILVFKDKRKSYYKKYQSVFYEDVNFWHPGLDKLY
jgi:hypothetical protein